jgi:hypothetical protein
LGISDAFAIVSAPKEPEMKKTFLLAATLIALTCTSAFAQGKATPIPSVMGPIPVTPESYPWNAASKLQTPVDVTSKGYVEEEYFISGKGNVYDWAPDGSLKMLASDRPYTTRILLRRPIDPARFSGTVFVELAHSGRGYDYNAMWGYAWEYLLSHGDAYVAITISGNTINALKKFDNTRYSALSFPPPVPNVCGERAGGGERGGGARGGGGGRGGGRGGAPPTFDDSVKWDVISQVGALVKSKSPSNPLARYNVQYLFSSDHTASDTHTYARAFTKAALTETGKPVIDGYLIKEGAGVGAVSPCGRIAADDPRRQFKNVGVPVIFLVSDNYAARLSSIRRDDSDQPGDQYRLYELAGSSHLDKWGPLYLPTLDDQKKLGVPLVSAAKGFEMECQQIQPLSDFPVPYVYSAMLNHLDNWVRKGTAPPRADRIKLENPGSPMAKVVTDMYGNGQGGIRNPWVDVPSSTFVSQMTGTSGPCDQVGYNLPLSMSKMEKLYGNSRNFQTRYFAGIDKMVREKWLLAPDAEKLKAQFRSANE